jgi:hypothetical protein
MFKATLGFRDLEAIRDVGKSGVSVKLFAVALLVEPSVGYCQTSLNASGQNSSRAR